MPTASSRHSSRPRRPCRTLRPMTTPTHRCHRRSGSGSSPRRADARTPPRPVRRDDDRDGRDHRRGDLRQPEHRRAGSPHAGARARRVGDRRRDRADRGLRVRGARARCGRASADSMPICATRITRSSRSSMDGRCCSSFRPAAWPARRSSVGRYFRELTGLGDAGAGRRGVDAWRAHARQLPRRPRGKQRAERAHGDEARWRSRC